MSNGAVRAPAWPAPRALGEVSERGVEAPSDRDDMADGARKAIAFARGTR